MVINLATLLGLVTDMAGKGCLLSVCAKQIQPFRLTCFPFFFFVCLVVCFSFCSSQLLGVADKYPGLLDGMVLMSSAPDVPALLTSFAASSLGIASLNNSTRFGKQGPWGYNLTYRSSTFLIHIRTHIFPPGSLNSSYLVSGDIYDAQRSLFHFPYFDPGIVTLI